MEQVCKYFISGVTALVSYFFGGWSLFLTVLFTLNVLDFILGILASDEAPNSKQLFKGGVKKGIMWLWVGISNLIFMLLIYLGYDSSVIIPNWVAAYYILMELVSLEENSEKLGMPLPSPVRFMINKFRGIMESIFGGDKK